MEDDVDLPGRIELRAVHLVELDVRDPVLLRKERRDVDEVRVIDRIDLPGLPRRGQEREHARAGAHVDDGVAGLDVLLDGTPIRVETHIVRLHLLLLVHASELFAIDALVGDARVRVAELLI